MNTPRLHVKSLQRLPYRTAWRFMVDYTCRRGARSPDILWPVQHDPVYTLGLAGRREHIVAAGGIPVVQSDRGGQVTYHGPGQLVLYTLVDLSRCGLQVRPYITLLEQAVIDCLAAQGLRAERQAGAPGVYVDGAKVAAVGLRVQRQCSYHGLAVNVDMDLAPYRGIHPCGNPQQVVGRLLDLGVSLSCDALAVLLCDRLRWHLGRAGAAEAA